MPTGSVAGETVYGKRILAARARQNKKAQQINSAALKADSVGYFFGGAGVTDDMASPSALNCSAN